MWRLCFSQDHAATAAAQSTRSNTVVVGGEFVTFSVLGLSHRSQQGTGHEVFCEDV